MKKLSLGLLALLILSGCSALSKKKEFKSETNVKPTSVAVLPVNRGTSNDVNSANLLTTTIGKNITGATIQDTKKTKELLEEKFGITVAGQLEAEDKIELEKELGVDGLVFVNINELKTTPTATMENFMPAGGLEKVLNIDVKVYNDGKLYKGENIIENSKVVITAAQLATAKEMVSLTQFLVKKITTEKLNAVEQILNMPETQQIIDFLMELNPEQRQAMVGALVSLVPTQEVASLFGDVFKKAGVSKGNVYEELITNAAKKIQL